MITTNIGYNLSIKLRKMDHDHLCSYALHFELWHTTSIIQPILRLDNSSGKYSLYKWRNEGNLPKFIDIIKDGSGETRLKIIGVDEL